LQVKLILELLKVCLKIAHLQVDGKFLQPKDGMSVGKSQSPVVINVCLEHFEKLAVDLAQDNPSLRRRYIGVTFVINPHGP
jgi:hypothetical protein